MLFLPIFKIVLTSCEPVDSGLGPIVIHVRVCFFLINNVCNDGPIPTF